MPGYIPAEIGKGREVQPGGMFRDLPEPLHVADAFAEVVWREPHHRILQEAEVSDALEAGYRMIDTAASYFNEEQVGNALRHSGLKREDVFVTTKLWVQDYEYDDALRAFDLSMKKLGLDYLDLYLLHKPYGNYYAAWRAAERLYREGRIRAIGVTSFSRVFMVAEGEWR